MTENCREIVVLANTLVSSAAFDEKADLDSQNQTLASAFAFFHETSDQLSRSYRNLEDKVARLTTELADVSAQKDEAHQKKEQLATRMQALLDVLPGGVIVLDAKGRIVEVNPAAQELLAVPLNGRLWREVISECFAPRNDDGLEVSTRSGRRVGIATSSLDGDRCSSGGQIILLTDLTETRKLQQHVSRSERLSAMGKMVSALAHQIRTPLSAAILYADHLCNSALSETTREAFSEKLLSRLHHMEHQVRDMLLFVKSELPLNDCVTASDLEIGLHEAAEVPLTASGSVCRWINQTPQVKIKCHREALISAIMNLINNSIQAVGENAEITVYISAKAQQLLIRVIDNGPGIPEALKNRAGELFATTKPHGTGLGLAVVQSVVRAHGGQFTLASTTKGTEAKIILPSTE